MLINFSIFVMVFTVMGGFCRSAPYEKPLNPGSILSFQNMAVSDCLNEMPDHLEQMTHDESSEMPHHEPFVPMMNRPLLSGGLICLLIMVGLILLGIYVFCMVRLCIKRLHKRKIPSIVSV